MTRFKVKQHKNLKFAKRKNGESKGIKQANSEMRRITKMGKKRNKFNLF